MSKYHVKIAQAGETVDGRTIQESWLRDIAETYNTKKFTAMIWPEHRRYFGNYGQVASVSLTEENGKVCLYADVEPNQSLLWENAYGQKLFYSLEVDTNFAKTGKAYLTGLGVTDSPASLGLEAHRFSQNSEGGEQRESIVYLCNTEIGEKLPKETAGNDTNQPGELGESNIPGWFKSLIFGKQQPDKGIQAMGANGIGEHEFTALKEQVAGISAQLDNLVQPLASLFTDASGAWSVATDAEGKVSFTKKPSEADGAGQGGGQGDGQGDGQGVNHSASQVTSQSTGQGQDEAFTALTAKVDGLAGQFTDLLSRLEQARGGTDVPAHTGAETKQVY